MVQTKQQKIKHTTTRIVETIREDLHIQHCRINVVNGAKEIFKKYKETLNTIDEDCISVRFYQDHNSLHSDLFPDPDFMSRDWFNLFVFNIDNEIDVLEAEIRGVELITLELRSRFDSKYYSVLVVSPISQRLLSKSYKEITGEECPIANSRYLGYDFDSIQILDYLDRILHTHSSKFLSRWSDALKKIETLQNNTLNLSTGIM